ncbi:MAG: PAS domain S-box protein, partial [Proteobacteria bacterium]|nr:PAS domain S-box protein [Pseudomonadota bacterium]
MAPEETLLEKEKSLEALQSSEKRYRRLFESAKDGILILDAATGRVVDVNPFMIRLLGYPYDWFCGKYIWELGVFKDIAASKEAFQVLQDHEYIRYEDLPLKTRYGHQVEVEFVSNVYQEDSNKVIQCNIRDITERKRDEAMLKRMMAAIEQVGEVVIVTDTEGTIQYVNPAFESLTGYTREEAMGKTPRILNSGKQAPGFYQDLWKTISSGKTWAGRMVNKRKDGELYTEDATITPVRGESGLIVNYVAVKRDVTDHQRLMAQLRHAQKMETVGTLAGGVAHDFNNILTGII